MTFLTSEEGAVTVDWVVLTAGLVGLGLAVMTVVSSGVQDLSTDIDEELSTSVISTSFGPTALEDFWDESLLVEGDGGPFAVSYDRDDFDRNIQEIRDTPTDQLAGVLTYVQQQATTGDSYAYEDALVEMVEWEIANRPAE